MAQGLPLTGTIQANDGDEARQKLTAMGLRLLELSSTQSPVAIPKPVRGNDLIVFNQHLAQLTQAGLPVEQSLRLIARDMSRGRLAASIEAVAEELDRGTPLAQAFEAHRGQFPSLYGKLVDAGVRASNLPGMLVNLGRHYELIHRLRATLWQTLTYPVIVFMFLMLFAAFASILVLPEFERMYRDFGTRLPALTQGILTLGHMTPVVLVMIGVLAIGSLVFWFLARLMLFDQWVVENWIVPLPLIGKLLKRNAISRWCDALSMGIDAGLPLPEAAELAGEAVGWASLRRDGREFAQSLTQGVPMQPGVDRRRWMLPVSVRTAITLAHERQNLPGTLRSLAGMYQQLAEMQLSALQAILAPVLMAVIGVIIFFTIAGLLLPMVKLFTNLT